jgi:membrane-associated phospholipid phosphatase
VVAIVLVTGVDRSYGGTHWPSDVLAGILIATAWLTFVVSVRWISDRALGAEEKEADHRRVSAGA